MAYVKPIDDAPHILLVDDDSRIRVLLSSYLRENGYRVSEAATAAEAENKLRGLDFDIMILDVMMPGESGFDFAKRHRFHPIASVLECCYLCQQSNQSHLL